jgi:hypothetical protein
VKKMKDIALTPDGVYPRECGDGNDTIKLMVNADKISVREAIPFSDFLKEENCLAPKS